MVRIARIVRRIGRLKSLVREDVLHVEFTLFDINENCLFDGEDALCLTYQSMSIIQFMLTCFNKF